MIKDFTEATRAAAEFSGMRIDQFDRLGTECGDIWIVAPADDQPEGTPCFMVFRDGRVVKKTIFDLDELNGYSQNPLRRDVFRM